MRVVVVEDEDALRAYLVPLLEREGFDVEAFGTGGEALAAVRDRRPDLVLTSDCRTCPGWTCAARFAGCPSTCPS